MLQLSLSNTPLSGTVASALCSISSLDLYITSTSISCYADCLTTASGTVSGSTPCTASPTATPTAPTPVPSAAPSVVPSVVPTLAPTFAPTAEPTDQPTSAPTVTPTVVPTGATAVPTATPTPAPSVALSTDVGMCGLIAATNVESIYSQWSCDGSGLTTTAPCDGSTALWSGVTCSAEAYPVTIYLEFIGLSGMVYK